MRLIPNSRAHIWGDNSGHFVCYEHPEEFARLVTGLFDSLTQRGNVLNA